jgi:hypothetical protein
MDRTVTFKQEETSGHEPQPGLDTKTDRLTDRQSQCDFDLTFSCNELDNWLDSVVVSCYCEKLVAEVGNSAGTQRKGNVRRWKPLRSYS